ncbi:MAG: tRNA lysidine(34) synthetase TilS [Planctomycetes bacterium]|nr:tRNA lysidine(34) synthetase TilS [Planctomycetota bacterium]
MCEPTGRLLAALRELGAAEVRADLWIACSGGADSTALVLHVAALRDSGRLAGTVGLLHVDHAQHDRSETAGRAVAALAARCGMALRAARLDLPRGAAEAALRDARYRAFATLLADRPAARVLTAHHADDVLETVVFRARRGAGRRGWAGIPPRRALPGGPLVLRPALAVRRGALRAILAAHPDVAVVDDPTNRDLRLARNHVRHVVLPALRARHGAGLDQRLLDIVARARDRVREREARARRTLAACACQRAPWHIDLTLADRTTPPELEELARLVHAALCGSAPGTVWLHRVVGLAAAPRGARVAAAADLLVERTADGLAFVATGRAPPPPAEPVSLGAGAAPTPFGATEWVCEVLADAVPVDAPPTAGPAFRAELSAAVLVGARLRVRRAGDALRIDATGRGRPLKELHARASVPSWDRHRLPLLAAADDRPLWVPGVGVDAAARPRGATARRVVAIRCRAACGIDLPPPAY